MHRFLVPALLCALLIPGAQATFSKPTTFAEEIGYMNGLSTNGEMALVSGAMTATLAGAQGSFGFFEAEATTISGLNKVCWTTCRESASNSLSITVVTGGSFAMCFPTPPTGRLEAEHALAMFVNLADDDDLNTFPVGKSLVAPAVNGALTLGNLANIPASRLSPTSIFSTPCSVSGGLVALDSTSSIVIRNAATTEATLTGKNAKVLFTGQPIIPAIQAAFFIAPFGQGSAVEFSPAPQDAARVGLYLGRIQDLIANLDASHASSTVDRPQTSATGEGAQDVLADLLNGAFIRLPNGLANGQAFPVQDTHFARFSALTVAGTPSTLAMDGESSFEINEGKVTGAKPLVGFGPVQLPWWSWALWVVAIGLFIARLAVKPDKTHPTWDRFKWIGWVATPLAWIFVIILWDAEVNAVLGSSLLRGSSGQGRLIIGGIELLLLSVIAFLAAGPLRIILRNTSLLARQGTFMGLAGAISALVGFLLGVTYLRAYLGLILNQVLQAVA